MARITPTITATRYNGITGDRRSVVVDIAITGTYTSATASDGGVKVTPALVGLQSIDYVKVIPRFSADAVARKVIWHGPSSADNSHVLALLDKDDDLQTGNSTSVSDIAATIEVVGR